jgi:hypothetical protein
VEISFTTLVGVASAALGDTVEDAGADVETTLLVSPEFVEEGLDEDGPFLTVNTPSSASPIDKN